MSSLLESFRYKRKKNDSDYVPDIWRETESECTSNSDAQLNETSYEKSLDSNDLANETINFKVEGPHVETVINAEIILSPIKNVSENIFIKKEQEDDIVKELVKCWVF